MVYTSLTITYLNIIIVMIVITSPIQDSTMPM